MSCEAEGEAKPKAKQTDNINYTTFSWDFVQIEKGL